MSRTLLLAVCALSLLCVTFVHGLSLQKLRSTAQTNGALEAHTTAADFVPPRVRLCVVYTYENKHDSDHNFPEHYAESVGTLSDGTTYGRDLIYRNPQDKRERWAPCVLVSLQGDLVNTRGQIMSKFKIGGNYPSPPCLGSVKRGFFGGTKNINGDDCTMPVGNDRIWIERSNVKWYASPNDIPLQAASQKPVHVLAGPPLPRTRLCVMYHYKYKHDDDWDFPEYFPGSNYIIPLRDGTVYGRDIRSYRTPRDERNDRWGPCTLVTLEGDRVNTKGEIIATFKLSDTYPHPPCLGRVTQSSFGGYKNLLGHKCTMPVGADKIWDDWGANARWGPKPTSGLLN